MSSPRGNAERAPGGGRNFFCGKFEKFSRLLHVFVQQGANMRGCLVKLLLHNKKYANIVVSECNGGKGL